VHRIETDPSLCSGFGSCTELAARSFVLGPDGIAVTHAAETDNEAALEAAASCPIGAIAVYDKRGRQAA
jgi:ferredoxin